MENIKVPGVVWYCLVICFLMYTQTLWISQKRQKKRKREKIRNGPALNSHQEEHILLSVGQFLRPLEVFKQNQPVYMWGAVLEFLLFMAELQQQVCLKGTWVVVGRKGLTSHLSISLWVCKSVHLTHINIRSSLPFKSIKLRIFANPVSMFVFKYAECYVYII